MKILVYGAGVLGCNLARNLFRARKDVTLLARGNWAEEIRKNGLRIKDKFLPRTSVSNIPVVVRPTGFEPTTFRVGVMRPYTNRVHFGRFSCMTHKIWRYTKQL